MGRLSELPSTSETSVQDEEDIDLHVSEPSGESYLDLLPEEIWILIIDSFALSRKRHFHTIVYSSTRGASDQQALCALCLTCRYFRGLAQNTLFRYPFSISLSEPVLGNIRNDPQSSIWTSQLCGTLLSSSNEAMLALSVRSISLDVAVDINYKDLLDRLPNLTHLIFFCSKLPIHLPAVPFTLPERIRDIEIQAYPYGDTLRHISTGCVPRDYTGHLVLSYGPLYGGSSSERTQTPHWPNVASLSLISPDIRPGGLAWLLGSTNTSLGLPAFACEHANLDGLHQMEPVWKYHSESLREFALTCPITSGTLPIERFSFLRKLVLSGWFLTNDKTLTNCSDNTRSRNIASHLPATLENLEIQKPHLDIFTILNTILLPRLSRLVDLEVDLQSFRESFKNFGIIYREDYPVTKLGRKWREILNEAGQVDEVCKARGIRTIEGGLREGLRDEARMRRAAKRFIESG